MASSKQKIAEHLMLSPNEKALRIKAIATSRMNAKHGEKGKKDAKKSSDQAEVKYSKVCGCCPIGVITYPK